MAQGRVDANTVGHITALIACEKHEEWQIAFGLLFRRAQGRVEANTLSYSTALSTGAWVPKMTLLAPYWLRSAGQRQIEAILLIWAWARNGPRGGYLLYCFLVFLVAFLCENKRFYQCFRIVQIP